MTRSPRGKQAGRVAEAEPVSPDPDTTTEQLLDIYSRLYGHYGPQHWWPGDSPLEMILGAILTQAAAWGNVEKALGNLKSHGYLSVRALRDIGQDELASLLKPVGYFNTKAKKLKAFIGHLWEHHDGNLESFLSQGLSSLRQELLSIYGIGEETADDITLYAAGHPSFVIDSYTRRILARIGLAPHRGTYEAYQELFHQNLAPDAGLYNEYHALFDRHAKETCKKEPRCHGCCLLELCATGSGATVG